MALIAWLHRAWQGEGARLTIARRLRPRHPRPVSLSQAAHFILMALIAWPSSHGFTVLGRPGKTSQKAAAPHPRPVSLRPNCSLHRLHGLWPSSHGPALLLGLRDSFKGSGFCNPTLLFGLRVLQGGLGGCLALLLGIWVLQPSTPFRT